MLTLSIGVALGFMLAVCFVVWQWSTISRIKKMVEEIQSVQSVGMLSAVGSPPLPEDRTLRALDSLEARIRELGERVAPQPKPEDPVSMLVRRIHQIEQDILSVSQASAHNTSAIEQHTARLDAHAAEQSRIVRDISGMEEDHARDIERIDRRTGELTSRMDRSLGQIGTALDALTNRVVDLSKRKAPPPATEAKG